MPRRTRPRALVSAILRHAVFVAAATAPCGHLGCGGSVEIVTSPDGSSGDASPDDASACTATPGTKPFLAAGSCTSVYYLFSGTDSECEPLDCGTLCNPTDPAVPAFAQGGTIIGCFITACSNCYEGCQVCGGPGPFQQLECDYGPCGNGRRPPGLGPCRVDASASRKGAYLARAAYLEAASVVAFEQLARALAAHGAPERLQRATLRAARDERRHARSVTELALRAGAAPPPARARVRGVRSLRSIAVDNAVEGCVNETFGAAVALQQAAAAADPDVRRVMRGIARDEVRHAELAWSVARWIDGRIGARDRQHVLRARRRAVRELLHDRPGAVDADLARDLGVPGAEARRRIASALAASLWRDA